MTSNELHLDNFSGNHYDMGFQQGELYEKRIDEAWSFVKTWELVEHVRPKILPKSLFFWIGKRRATKAYKRLFDESVPRQAERIRGISKGSGTDLKRLYLFQAMETMLAAGCTSIGISPEKSSTDEVLMCRNFDIYSSLIPMYIGRYNEPKNGIPNIDYTLCAFPGNFHGMNQEGLAITYNYADPTDEYKPGIPISILIQEALENCETTDEAVRIFKEKPRGNGAILLVGDPSGNIQTLEISCNQMAIRYPEDGFIVNANDYLTEEMKPIDGKKWHESSEKRFSRAYSLVSDMPKINENALRRILSDHGSDRNPGSNTICVHNRVISTTISMLFNLSKRTMSVAVGNPCRSEYWKFNI